MDARFVTLHIRAETDSTRAIKLQKLREQGTETDFENTTPTASAS